MASASIGLRGDEHVAGRQDDVELGPQAAGTSASNTPTPCSSAAMIHAVTGERAAGVRPATDVPDRGVAVGPLIAVGTFRGDDVQRLGPRQRAVELEHGRPPARLLQERRDVEVVVVVGIERIGVVVVAEQLGDRVGDVRGESLGPVRPAGRAVDAVEAGGDDGDLRPRRPSRRR